MHPYDQINRNANVERIKNSLVPKKLRDRCDGTGNQFYSMYQLCEKCNGTGTISLTRSMEHDGLD